MSTLALLLLTALSVQDPEPPSAREQAELAARYLQRAPFDALSRQDERELLERLAAVPALSEREEERWREDLLELWSDGPELETRSGSHWWQEEPERRGRYLIGGKTRRPRGLLIGMHGGGSGVGEASSAAAEWGSAAKELGWVAVFPEVLVKTSRGWTTEGTEEYVLELIDAALRTFEVDPNRVYLAGHSMGGYGSWTLGGHHADRIAGIAPSAGAPSQILERGEVVDIEDGIVPNLGGVRVRVYQSDDDVQVPPAANRVAARRMAEAQERWGGYDFEYWEVEGRGHDHPPGGLDDFLERLEGAERDPRPESLRWQPALDWKRQYAWLHWETPRYGTLVEARLDREANRIEVTSTGEPAGLSVLVERELVDFERELVVSFAGREVFRGRPEARLEVLVETARRGDPEAMYCARIPLAP